MRLTMALLLMIGLLVFPYYLGRWFCVLTGTISVSRLDEERSMSYLFGFMLQIVLGLVLYLCWIVVGKLGITL